MNTKDNSTPVTLIAIADAYYRGQRIKRGSEVEIIGTRPKWAAPKGSKAVLALNQPIDPDTKPKTTQAAAAARRREWDDAMATIAPGSR